MQECRVIDWSLTSNYPAPLDPWRPGESKPAEVDWAEVDCLNVGITISNSVWDFVDQAADDPDNTVTLGTAGIDGFVAYRSVTGTTSGVTVRLENTVTLSDGRVLKAQVSVPVEAFVQWAA